MYQRIFVPVDQSAPANMALDEAIRLAGDLGAGLILAHSVELPQYGNGNPERMDSLAMEQPLMEVGAQILEEARDKARKSGLEPETHLLENHGESTAEVLLAAARESRAELIVMGTHGRTGLSHLLMGSVAESMLRHAPLPILLIRRHTEAA